MMKNNQRGSIALIFLVVVVLGVTASAGYFVHKAKTSANSSTTVSSSSIKCTTDKCFQEKFVKCEPASLQQKAVFSGGSKDYYEIISGDKASCKMLYRTDSDKLDLTCNYKDTASYNTGQDSEFVTAAAKNETDIAFGRKADCTGSKVEKLKQTKSTTIQN